MKIFIVDDDSVLRLIIREHLQTPDRQIREFSSGEELLTAIHEEPDLILLDISMPGMGGIETCRAWRDAESKHGQIIFISTHESLETRLAAYDAGGNDYIVKPIEALELQRKVRIAELSARQQKALTEQANFAGQTAFTALSTLGEMGVIQQFMRALFAANTPATLAKAIFEALQQYGLNGLLEIRIGNETHTYAKQGECSAQEISLLNNAAQMGRLFQLRDRLVINFSNITLLLHNLPLSEQEKAGRLRDHLAILVEGADTRILAIEAEQNKHSKHSGLYQTLHTLANTLDEIQRHQATNRIHAEDINNRLLDDQLNTMEYLGLADGQEKGLINIAKKAHEDLSKLRDEDGTLGDQLRAIVGQLHKLASNTDS